MKQSSIDWLINKLKSYFTNDGDLQPTEPTTSIDWLFSQIPSACKSSKGAFDALQRAKAMHKEEIENAYKSGWDWGLNFGNDCWEEMYYNETFNTK